MEFKTFAIFLLTIIGATQAVNNSTTTFMRNYQNYNNSLLRTDNYLDLNRRQYADYIQQCDKEIEDFKKNYIERLSVVTILSEMMTTDIVKIHEHLNPLEVLSDIGNDCVAKYRSKIPTVAVTKTAFLACYNAAYNQINNLVNPATGTKNNLNSYYVTNIERDFKSCTTRFPALDINYTECLAKVISAATTHTTNTMKTFRAQIESALCSSRAYVKTALDCTFIAQNRTITLNAEANLMIDRCIHGLDDCERCGEGRFCEQVYYMPQYQIEHDNATMPNPFYGRNSSTNCLMIEVY
ncbi:uncharacterized protein LOC106093043 [Stomoxys calcitrans]|uniref:Protein TsetseEP domain-containing protein n=1 Tax=Stomoxys calcitrans TaxID=35570 RepID=A0A1I8NPM2_STOCA|nr:uncharacterized protein LOC106093043 [Stomoxys calcitrans]